MFLSFIIKNNRRDSLSAVLWWLGLGEHGELQLISDGHKRLLQEIETRPISWLKCSGVPSMVVPDYAIPRGLNSGSVTGD